MRVSDKLQGFSVPTNLKLVYARITASRLTLCFFIVSLLHFILQISFQAWAFDTNLSASSFLSEILSTGGFEPHQNFAVLVPLSKDGNAGGELRVCTYADMVSHRNIYECPIMWKGRSNANTTDGDYGVDPLPAGATSFPAVDPTAPLVNVAPIRSIPVSSTVQTGGKVPNSSQLTTRTQPAGQTTTRTQSSIRSAQTIEDKGDDNDGETEDRKRFAKRTNIATSNSFPSLWRREQMTVVPLFEEEGSNVGEDGSTISSIVGVNIPYMFNPITKSSGVTLTKQCVQMILWPNQIIHNTKRQDVTFMAFQFWVLGLSVVAILNESIPHIAASVITHILATSWSVYQIFNTASFRNEFVRSTIRSGLCGGTNLLPNYWSKRGTAETAVLVINCVSLVAFLFLSWRLVKLFGWQTFKRIGASIQINRIYMIVLIFSVGLQMAFFFVIALMGVLVDVMCNSILGQTAENRNVYLAFAIMACILMVPWLWLGWVAVRREANKLMSAFITVCILLISGWAALFVCQTFRWLFREWKFFAAMSVASGVMMTATTALGIVCFYNFHKGLKRFLSEKPENPDEFTTVTSRDEEKGEVINFPAAGPIPTYAVAFGAKSKAEGSPRSSFDSGEIGSPLHDPVFLDPYAPGYDQKTSEANLPPRFRTQRSFADSQTTYLSSVQTGSRKASMNERPQVGRADSLATSESGSNPFSLERGNSTGSGSSGRTGRSDPSVKPKTYATAGSHFVPTIETRHQQDNSRSATRGWVIE